MILYATFIIGPVEAFLALSDGDRSEAFKQLLSLEKPLYKMSSQTVA